MNQFVYEAIEFLREYKFNGLDVDWEYPRGSEDKVAYVNLLRELRIAFEGTDLLVRYVNNNLLSSSVFYMHEKFKSFGNCFKIQWYI